MIIVDTALQAREAAGQPIRVGMLGAGFMARGLPTRSSTRIPACAWWPSITAASSARSRSIPTPASTRVAGAARSASSTTRSANGRPVVTDDAMLLARSPQIDVIVDVTGAVEFGARVALEAFRHGKHVVLMNAELDATLGPILQVYARKARRHPVACDGDQPGVQINLFRCVRGLGLIPRVMGNIKGLQDPYRTPTTQKGFAEKWGQNPAMVTSFADGSKVSFEQAIVANATGLTCRCAGMSRGVSIDGDVDELDQLVRHRRCCASWAASSTTWSARRLTQVYCLAEHPDPKQRHYLNLYKMGEGPLYSFYTPYHLCHFEVPDTIARVVLFGDAAANPLGGPAGRGLRRREARSASRRGARRLRHVHDLRRGGQRRRRCAASGYLPEGLVEGCALTRDIPKDAVLTYDDVELPPGRLADELRAEQYEHFSEDGSVAAGSRADEVRV